MPTEVPDPVVADGADSELWAKCVKLTDATAAMSRHPLYAGRSVLHDLIEILRNRQFTLVANAKGTSYAAIEEPNLAFGYVFRTTGSRPPTIGPVSDWSGLVEVPPPDPNYGEISWKSACHPSRPLRVPSAAYGRIWAFRFGRHVQLRDAEFEITEELVFRLDDLALHPDVVGILAQGFEWAKALGTGK